jgi:hypothetical protein
LKLVTEQIHGSLGDVFVATTCPDWTGLKHRAENQFRCVELPRSLQRHARMTTGLKRRHVLSEDAVLPVQ